MDSDFIQQTVVPKSKAETKAANIRHQRSRNRSEAGIPNLKRESFSLPGVETSRIFPTMCIRNLNKLADIQVYQRWQQS
jgi:hypothetical protein